MESPRRRATMQHVADRAGVSRTTASFVLNGRDDEMRISEDAAERVRRAARELDYRPNIAARSLSRQLSRSIAVLSDEVTTDGFSGEVITGCLAAATAADHTLLIAEYGGEDRLRDQFVTDFVERQVDGFVLARPFQTIVDVPTALRGRPIVLLNALDARRETPAVVLDEEGAAASVIDHLVGLGHRDDVWVLGELPEDLVGAVLRRQGLVAAMATYGLELAGVVPCKWWPESARDALRAMLDDGGRPTAIVCLNDRIALGAYQALAAAGRRVPDDVSVVSFDDTPMAAWLEPRLTSVAIPHVEMGRRAVSLLLSGVREPIVHRVTMPLRERGSTAPPG